MKLAYFILLVFLLGCVQLPPAVPPAAQQINGTTIEPPEQAPGPEPQTNLTIPESTKLQSYLEELGFEIPWTPKSQDFTWLSTYEVPKCIADLEFKTAPCTPQTNQGQGYVNITWCSDNDRKYLLSTQCEETSAESLKYSLLASKKNLTSRILMYSTERMSRFTLEIDEVYDLGKLKFVYTNHGKYPLVSKITEINGQRTYCVDDGCTKMFIFLQHPAKYVLIETDYSSQTQLFMSQFIDHNPDYMYPVFSFDGLQVFNEEFAYNHGVKICRNHFGILRAEPVWFNWEDDLITSDNSANIRVFSPFGFFRDPQFWFTPAVIGSQIDTLTGEFNKAKIVEGNYSLCYGLVEQCKPACDKADSLIVGNCPALGAIPLNDDLQTIFSYYDKFYNFTLFKTLYCVTLLNGLGEQQVVGEQKTGDGMVLATLNTQYPLTVITVKGEVEKEYLKSILDIKYNFNFDVVRVDTRDSCRIYRYGNGYGSICHIDGFSIVSYTHCTPYTKCKSEVEYGVNLLVDTSAE